MIQHADYPIWLSEVLTYLYIDEVFFFIVRSTEPQVLFHADCSESSQRDVLVRESVTVIH